MKAIDKAIKILAIFEILIIFSIILILLAEFFVPKINGKTDNKLVNKNIISNTVEIKLTKEMIDLFIEDFDYALTQEQKENGFTEIKKNDDGSATYTIKKKDYDVFLKNYKETAKQAIDELTEEGAFSSIKNITYNEDLSKIVISANKEKFEDSFDSMVIMSCGLTSCMYQMFDINAKGKCTVEVKDSNSGKVFKTTIYPDAMQKE